MSVPRKDIEVELRGPLSREQYDEIISFLGTHGTKLATKDRILIDYSTFLPGGVADRQKDIRVRVTNGVPEIVVKLGGWGGTEQRKELSVKTAEGSFDTLVSIFAALGFAKGVLCVRKSLVYEFEGIEFAVVEVPGHSFYFEAEYMAHEGEEVADITRNMREVITKIGLSEFSKEDFFGYIERLNAEANEIFDAASAPPDYFRTRFGV